MIGDFGVPIAILIMVLVDSSIQDTYTQVGSWRDFWGLLQAPSKEGEAQPFRPPPQWLSH